MRFPPVDLGTGPWSKRTVASQIENFGPMSGAHRPRGSKGEVSLDNADAVIDGATWLEQLKRPEIVDVDDAFHAPLGVHHQHRSNSLLFHYSQRAGGELVARERH